MMLLLGFVGAGLAVTCHTYTTAQPSVRHVLDCATVNATQCATYSYVCDAADKTCTPGQKYTTGVCATDEICAAFAASPTIYLDGKCCNTDNCNEPAPSGVTPTDNSSLSCFAYSTGRPEQRTQVNCASVAPGSTKCAVYSFECTAGDAACTPAQIGQTLTTSVCATENLCNSFAQAPALYKNFKCCNTNGCNDPTGMSAPVDSGLMCFASAYKGPMDPKPISTLCAPDQKKCAVYGFKCVAGDTTCTAGSTFVAATCATDEICSMITSPAARGSYINAKCCSTSNCNDPTTHNVMSMTTQNVITMRSSSASTSVSLAVLLTSFFCVATRPL